MKTLNTFLNIFYCVEMVESCISFQHSLPHLQCKSSSAYKSAEIPKKIKNKKFGSLRNHSCTVWRTSSSERNFFPPIVSLNGPNILKSLRASSGEYGGWGRHSKCRSAIVTTVVRAVWGLALLRCKRTLANSNPRCFDDFCSKPVYDALVTVVPPGM